jgi:hypothetical protein
MANPNTVTTDHPIGGGGSPSYLGAPGGKVGFFQDPYGVGAVSQPSGNNLIPLLRGQQAGVIATYSTTQSPSAVSANTTSEKAMTVQSGTGASMLLATTDLCYVNKPTAQAGLGIGNIRVSASNTAQVTMSNFTGGSITPTGSEVYGIVAIRGMQTISATLSPAAVAANSVVEQQFTITPPTSGSNINVGLPVGNLLQVVKPTSQAGLDIVGCRIVSNNVIGITFANVTASPITPTAAESYTLFSLSGLDAMNNSIFYGFNVGTVGAIGAGVVATGGSTTLTGLLATDVITGIMKPTNGAAATNAAFVINAVPTANTLTLYYGGIGTGATPTASEVYGVHTVRLNPVAPMVLYTQTLTPASVAANTTAEQTFTVTGLISGTPVWVNKSSWTSGLGICGVRVSGTNTLAITYCNSTGSAITPPAESYVIGNFQVPLPGAGNCAYQLVSPSYNQAGNLLNGIASALGPTASGGMNLISNS